MFFDGLTIQQKLVKYLLKSTIGKLLNQIQWDKVIIENNTITLNNVQLNYNLFFNALANHSILFKNGIIKSLIVTVPSWSTFFQDGLQISINDLNLILSTCDPINQSIAQIPILSTSFHFADEFIRSEVLESNTPQEPSALSDLAHIIENIIGKAMVSLTNVTIEIQQNTTDQSSEINNQSNEFNNQSNENYDQSSDVQLEALMLNIDKVTICDHVSEQLDIPEPLQLSNNDLLSRVVKYMSLEGMAISHCIPNANVVQLTSIPLSWIRLLFTQENVDFENSQNSDVENNFVFSDINVNIWTKDITCIAHIHDFQNASNFLKTLKKDDNLSESFTNSEVFYSETSLSQSQSINTKGPIQFACDIENINIILLTLSTNIQLDPVNYHLSNTQIKQNHHIFVQARQVSLKNQPLDNTSLLSLAITSHVGVVQEFNSDTKNYSTIAEYKTQPQSLSTSNYISIIEMQDLPTIHIPLSISIDLYRSDLSRQLDTQIIVKFPFLSLFTRFNLLQEFKAQYYTDTLSQVANTTIKPQAITSIEVIIPQCRLKLEFISDHFNNRSPIIDLLNLRLNNTESFNNWNLDIPLLLFGYHIPTKDTFKHISYTSAVSIKFNNQDDIVEQGLSEQLMSTQHKLLRESNASDSISARSWSDVGEESPRVGIGKCRSPPLETQDPSIMASKYIIRVQSGKLVVEVDQIDFVFMKWIGETLQQLAFKPLEANQPSTAVIFDIQHVNVALTNTGTNFYHRYDLYDINGITSLNSILNCKNLLSIELHVYDVKWYTNTAFHDHPSWCALTRVPSSTEHPMIHLLYTQNDDLDIHVRQILLTLMLRHTFLHLPFKSPIDIFNDPGSFYEPLPTLLESFMDLQVCVSDFQHSHCTTDAISIVKYDHLKCATNIISGSSTCGIDVTINNIHLFLTVNTSLIAILQKNEYQVDFNDINATVASFHMMGFANLAILEGLNVNVRLNDVGVYPSADWSIGFINLTVMTRNDSMQALIGYLNSFAPTAAPVKGDDEPVVGGDINIFENVEDNAFGGDVHLDSTSTYTPSEFDEEDLDWHTDFDLNMERVEEILLDTVTVNPSYHQLQIVPNYLDSLQAETKIVETPDVRIRITDGNISWKLYKGSDWSTDPTSPSESSYSSSIGESQADDFAKHAYQVEIKLYKLEFEIELYPIDTLISKSILFRVRDIEIIDNIKTSQWNKFLTYRIPDHGAKPRETDSDMISFTMIGHRNNQIEEFQLRFSLLPIQLHIDQDTLLFMVGFFAKSDLLVSPDLARSISSNPTIPSKNDNTFFQQCKIDPISIQIDYKPKHVDYRSLKGGQVIEMINFLHLDGSKLYLKRIHVNGVQGWGRLVNRVMGIWLPHVRETQLSQLASGVPGVKSLVNLGTGIKDLVILPIEQFQKDGRLMRGLSKGTTSFLKATTMETVRLGSKLANGAQTILEQAEGMIKSKEMTDIPTQNISKLSDQPKDIVQGLQMGFQSLNQGVQRAFQTNQSTRIVPISALQPVIGLTEALAKTLVGIQNTLDHTQQSRMHNKYKSS